MDEITAALKADLLTAEDKAKIAGVSEVLSPLAEVDLPTTLAVSLLEDNWDAIGEALQLKIIDVVDAQLGSPLPDEGPEQDPDAASTLRELLARPSEYLTLTLQQWRERRSDLLADGKSTLVLFDRDFSREGAATDAGEGEVERLLAQAPSNWRIGLLTHTVSNSDAEVTTWRNLSDKFQASSSRFLVIGKARLSQAPKEFPRMLKLTLLAPALEQMQHHVHEAVQEVWTQAHEHARGIDPYTLEAALTGDRIRDGAWGPETLLRVTSAFTQDSVRAKLRANLQVHESSTLITSLSRVKLPEIPDRDRVRQELAQIERLEYYDSPEHLNELFFPIEAGDIFALEQFETTPGEFEKADSVDSATEAGQAPTPARSDPTQYLILLAQPCDLAIRAKGQRSNDLAYVRVAPLKPPTDRVISQPGGSSATAFDLPFFDKDTGAGVEVRLSQQRIVPLVALDMCAFNSDGCARMGVGQHVSHHVLPNWQKRFTILQKVVRKAVQQYSGMQPHSIPEGGAEALTRALTGTGAWPDLSSLISVRENTIHYGIRRVTRLREPYRSALLSRMAQREARDAFDPSLLDKQHN
ncbi:hypothetical protein ACGFZQ_42955 [Streptomyces sp. NPDC048254]|uniref:hypothetical protein n=1 Tax=Streptomyces sp. NPDC048254 TaxID=3365525 RepID=UPI0037244A48